MVIELILARVRSQEILWICFVDLVANITDRWRRAVSNSNAARNNIVNSKRMLQQLNRINIKNRGNFHSFLYVSLLVSINTVLSSGWYLELKEESIVKKHPTSYITLLQEYNPNNCHRYLLFKFLKRSLLYRAPEPATLRKTWIG